MYSQQVLKTVPNSEITCSAATFYVLVVSQGNIQIIRHRLLSHVFIFPGLLQVFTAHLAKPLRLADRKLHLLIRLHHSVIRDNTDSKLLTCKLNLLGYFVRGDGLLVQSADQHFHQVRDFTDADRLGGFVRGLQGREQFGLKYVSTRNS